MNPVYSEAPKPMLRVVKMCSDPSLEGACRERPFCRRWCISAMLAIGNSVYVRRIMKRARGCCSEAVYEWKNDGT
jgi:hypothetical protein